MAIVTIYKGVILTCLLVSVLAQDDLEAIGQDIVTESVTPIPIVLEEITELPVETTQMLQSKLAEAKIFQDQAANAVYNFTAMLVDGIMDNTQGRSEKRDGLNVEGSYWYSDGYFRRTVNYAADENGYKILSELIEPLGDGPKIDLNGRADIQTDILGQKFAYSITKNDIGRFNKPEETIEKQIELSTKSREATVVDPAVL